MDHYDLVQHHRGGFHRGKPDGRRPGVRFKNALKWLRSPKLLVPASSWSWVVGPALAWLIILGPAAVGGTCRRADVVQSGTDRAVPAAGGDESPRRHDLHRSLHPAGDRRHGRVDARDGAVADQGADA